MQGLWASASGKALLPRRHRGRHAVMRGLLPAPHDRGLELDVVLRRRHAERCVDLLATSHLLLVPALTLLWKSRFRHGSPSSLLLNYNRVEAPLPSV